MQVVYKPWKSVASRWVAKIGKRALVVGFGLKSYLIIRIA